MIDFTKIMRRKSVVGFGILGVFLILGAFNLLWDGITHKGKGYETSGGYGQYDSMPTEERSGFVEEKQYKRDQYLGAGMLFLLGGLTWWGVIAKWKELNEKEKSPIAGDANYAERILPKDR